MLMGELRIEQGELQHHPPVHDGLTDDGAPAHQIPPDFLIDFIPVTEGKDHGGKLWLRPRDENFISLKAGIKVGGIFNNPVNYAAVTVPAPDRECDEDLEGIGAPCGLNRLPDEIDVAVLLILLPVEVVCM